MDEKVCQVNKPSYLAWTASSSISHHGKPYLETKRKSKMVSTETKAVLRIVTSSVALYFNLKFFFSKDGPSQGYRRAFILIMILAGIFGYHKGTQS